MDKRVESLQIDVDEIVRLRRENEEAVRLLRESKVAHEVAKKFAVEFDSPIVIPDNALPYKSGEVCAEALTMIEKIDAYLDKREEG